MFANQISKRWHLGVVLFDISLMVAEGRNIFSEHTKDWVYFLSCELTIQLSICLFYVFSIDLFCMYWYLLLLFCFPICLFLPLLLYSFFFFYFLA